MRYCEGVRRSALYGEKLVLTERELTCGGAEVALGFSKPLFGEARLSGTKGVLLSPLQKMDEADVVLIVATPSRIMRIAELYSKIEGPIEASFSGDAAVCGEATATPFIEGTPNLSMLCSGARFFAGYRENEVVLGMPLEVFERLSATIVEDSITRALCGCLMDDIPKPLVDKLVSMGFEKATDHFMGYFGNSIVRLHVLKDDDMSEFSLHLPVRFGSEEEAKRAIESATGMEINLRRRENWVDIALVVSMHEPLHRACRKEYFEEEIKRAIEGMLEAERKLRKAVLKRSSSQDQPPNTA
ncbi:MAG: hypothetical protein PWR26_473 [Methanosarcinales archaeon]|nr:MAG: hypothetical protein XD46_0671 [Euryarchaeota archaeon 55_53]KUK29618.1 MAG: hypothetical protein XD62_1300 [Methanosarcinales archeaon 56_1174]MDI3487756.1 hypothetical protein [Methanosarcinales archaeon]MDN5294888.1 hypothetical protein [Methanosarcinales archaeon]